MAKIAIIGSGISGLSAAAYAAKQGHEVYVFEKNDIPGGRARQFITPEGYTFDMGPSWYWMPDIIDRFFADFGYKSSDFYKLVSLQPQFDILFPGRTLSMPSRLKDMYTLFEEIEPGSGPRLEAFMKAAQYKYEVGMQQFVYKPCLSWWEFVRPSIALSALKLNLFSNFRDYVARYFSHPQLRTLMEFPVIFLGASTQQIPALYSLMNYGGYALGTWYPMGGFYELVKAMHYVAASQGARFYFNHTVEQIKVQQGKVDMLLINGEDWTFDAVIASSDYHHTESLLEAPYRNYDDQYWDKRVFAPSCLIFYLGFRERIPGLRHHTLFFEYDLDDHIHAIYTDKQWPEQPLFYACCPSVTDPSVAPEGHENLFLLMPLAPGLHDDEQTRARYFDEMLQRLEQHTGVKYLKSKLDYKRSYCVRDFVHDYNAYKGNAYGLANTLGQTAVLKPSIRNKKLSNLLYTGQLTVPGPGVPPSIISGKIVAGELNNLKAIPYETAI